MSDENDQIRKLFQPTDGQMQGRFEENISHEATKAAQDKLFGQGNRIAMRPKDFEDAGIKRLKARVEVRRELNEAGMPDLEVAVYSVMKPGMYKRTFVGLTTNAKMVEVAAGACCEELCACFRDPFDPSQAAADAKAKFYELVEQA